MILLARKCLRELCILRLSEWDVLVFLHQHGTTLMGPEHISRLLGYSKTTISAALERLESFGLISQSHVSQETRRFECAPWRQLSAREEFEFLVAPERKRAARLLIARELGTGSTSGRERLNRGLHFAESHG